MNGQTDPEILRWADQWDELMEMEEIEVEEIGEDIEVSHAA